MGRRGYGREAYWALGRKALDTLEDFIADAARRIANADTGRQHYATELAQNSLGIYPADMTSLRRRSPDRDAGTHRTATGTILDNIVRSLRDNAPNPKSGDSPRSYLDWWTANEARRTGLADILQNEIRKHSEPMRKGVRPAAVRRSPVATPEQAEALREPDDTGPGAARSPFAGVPEIPEAIRSIPDSELRDISRDCPTVAEMPGFRSQDDADAELFDRFGLDPAEMTAIVARQRAADPPRTDDWHLILRGDLTRLNGTARGQRALYTTVREIGRRTGRRPNVLSANAVLVNPRRKRLCLHLRSFESATMPGMLHIVGGALNPASDFGDGDRRLKRAAIREVFEETPEIAVIDDHLAILQHEVSTNFTMVTFLGVAVDPVSERTGKGFWEGVPLWFDLDELPRLMGSPPLIDILDEERLDNVIDNDERHAFLRHRSVEWTGTGLQAVLVWLATGTPLAGAASMLGREDAEALLSLCLDRLARRRS